MALGRGLPESGGLDVLHLAFTIAAPEIPAYLLEFGMGLGFSSL